MEGDWIVAGAAAGRDAVAERRAHAAAGVGSAELAVVAVAGAIDRQRAVEFVQLPIAGEAGRVALKRWLPKVENNALEKGREAILKAGQNREFRINLAKLIMLPGEKSAK